MKSGIPPAGIVEWAGGLERSGGAIGGTKCGPGGLKVRRFAFGLLDEWWME